MGTKSRPQVVVNAIGAEYEVTCNGKRRGVYLTRETATAAARSLARGIVADARIMEPRAHIAVLEERAFGGSR